MVAKEKPEAAFAGLGPKELREAAAGPALQQAVRKCALKPSVVFREIVSFIKGSSAALDAAGGRLSRDEYLALGRKMAPTFDRSDGDDAADGGRAEVWEYFLRYEAWKAAYGAYDVMDAAAAIFAVIRDVGYPGPRIDEVYVDEVQDFTQAELRLFLACCADPNAVFLTGDTCQTIARGVGFRFDDITTMFFHLREAQAARLKAEGRTLAEGDCVQVPEVNKLSTNYRTHNGILGAASELVSLLLALFPASVDALAKDRGHFDGPRPLLLSRSTPDDLAILLVGSDPSHSQIEFGAHQAVLVRSQASKERLPAAFANALVLTIFEAKGLEFDDVFIFDFFEDSPADERTWRVVTGCDGSGTAAATGGGGGDATDEEAAWAAQIGGAPRAEAFDRQRHALLNEELKMFTRR